MSDSTKTPAKKLSENDITTKRPLGRRAFLGIMAAGTVGATMMPTQAAASDIDNGTWTDEGSCPRGNGGVYTNLTDSDNGNLTDTGGYGRGAPYC